MTSMVRLAGETIGIGAVAALIVLGCVRFLGSSGPPPSAVGVSLGASVGIDFSAGSRTVVLFLQSSCVFCQEAMPFYRRLTARDTADLQIVVAAPATDADLRPHLLAQEVEPDAVVYVEEGELPVPGTPTLLVVDAQGTVTRSWVGLLDDDREDEVRQVLFGEDAAVRGRLERAR